jgi:hypothetical protein
LRPITNIWPQEKSKYLEMMPGEKRRHDVCSVKFLTVREVPDLAEDYIEADVQRVVVFTAGSEAFKIFIHIPPSRPPEREYLWNVRLLATTDGRLMKHFGSVDQPDGTSHGCRSPG